jgi:glycosyltransferase involved in cell wall biosynthesis
MGRNGRQDLGNIVAAGMGGEFLYYYYPMNHSVIDSSKMIVMHNSFLTKKIANDFPGKQVKYIPHNAKKRMIPKNRIQQLHKSLGIPEGSITVATFGFMNESKKIGLISQALCKLMPKYTDIYYLICGEDKDGIVKNEYFNYDGIRERIKVSGYVDGLESFTEYIDFSDIVINLRFPSTGETSGTMIRSMAQGKPVIVYDLPTLLDIPDTALVKIPISDNPSYLVSSLEELINNKIFRESVGKAAEDYAKEELDMDRNADLYIEAFKIVKSFQIVS